MKNRLVALLLISLLQSNYAQTTTGTPCPDQPTITFGGKTYHTVMIGDQCWLKENLDIGTMIDGIKDQTNNGIIEKYCYHDDPANCEIYGGLYTWNEAMKYIVSKEKVQGICPDGWHIPTLDELEKLKATVNSSGNALKDVSQGQGVGTGIGTNTSGFTAMLAGSRGYGGHFSHLRVYIWIWSSTDNINDGFSNVLSLDYSNNDILIYQNGKSAGFSVRCIKGAGLTNVENDYSYDNIPSDFQLSQNYPNPFNPVTEIKYSIGKASNVSIKVYDVMGREVAELINDYKPSGNYSVDFNASNLASGVYYYRMISGNYSNTKKLLLMK